MLRVGLIGCGMISSFHLAAWKKIPGVSVVAVCDPDRRRAAAQAEQFEVAKIYSSASAMLDKEPLDALDIASPREHHAEHVRLAAARGLPALCQKPLTPSYEESVQLVEEVGERCRLMVHENWRFRPYYRRAGEWLRQARIGTIRSATMIVRGSGFRQDKNGRYPALDRQPFMRVLSQMLVSEGLIHQIDVLRWLLGPLTVRFARLGRSCPKLLGEDRALIVMESASGVPAVLDADSAAAGYPARSADDLELIGTKGTIRFRDMQLRLETDVKGEQFAYDAAEAYQVSFDACIRHFADCLGSGELFETNPRDNLATLRLVDEIYRSAGPLRMTLP